MTLVTEPTKTPSAPNSCGVQGFATMWAARTPAIWGIAILSLLLPQCSREEPAGPESPRPPRLFTLDGETSVPPCFSTTTTDLAPVTVFVFTHTDCPVANRYAPEISRIHRDYEPKGVQFYLVYVDPKLEPSDIRQHLNDWNYEIPALRDPHHELVQLAQAVRTPEVAIFSGAGELLYGGRIDDLYEDYGKVRPRPTRHDVRETLDAILAHRSIETPRTEAVGCYIADLRDGEKQP